MPTLNNLPQPPSLLKTIGPSFILLGLALGSGELILWPYLAANYGLGLLWGGLLGISMQFVLNTESMRYTLAWGESVFVGMRKLSIFITLWYIFSTYIPWSLPGFSSASSQIFSHLFPFLNEKWLAVGFLLFTGLMLSLGKTLYKTMEVFQKTIILLGLPFAIIIALLLAKQADYVEMMAGLVGRGDGWWFFPPMVALASFLGAFAYSGAGGNLNLAQSYYIKEKGFGMGKYSVGIKSLLSGGTKAMKLEGATFANTALNRKRWQQWWRLINLEHFLVFWLLGLISILILSVLAKSLLFGQAREAGLAFVFQESGIIGTRLGGMVGVSFLAAVGVMLFSTQVGVLESSSRIISENLLLLFYKPGKKLPGSLAFYLALWGQIGLGIIIYLAGWTEPRFLLTLGAVLNAAAMMVSFPLIFILNKIKLPKELQPAKWRIGVMGFALFFFLVLLVITLRDFRI